MIFKQNFTEPEVVVYVAARTYCKAYAVFIETNGHFCFIA